MLTIEELDRTAFCGASMRTQVIMHDRELKCPKCGFMFNDDEVEYDYYTHYTYAEGCTYMYLLWIPKHYRW